MSQLTKAQKDYLRAIYELSGQEGGARITDIANCFGKSKASASVAIKKLQKKGLIRRNVDRLVFLTEEGKRQAKQATEIYSLMSAFLTSVLKVGPRAASADACTMESLSEETFNAIRSFLGFISAT
jgi:Mn-dependent DtxR family transcriptional regulator